MLGLGLAHAVVWYPAEILITATGFIYGFWVGLPLLMLAWLINGLVCFYAGRHAARPALLGFLGRERFLRYERVVEGGGPTLLLPMRLVPFIPFSLSSYVAGAAGVRVWRFVWTTMVGYLPLTALFVYLGSQLEELSPTDPFLWGGALVLVGMLWLSHRILPRFTSD